MRKRPSEPVKTALSHDAFYDELSPLRVILVGFAEIPTYPVIGPFQSWQFALEDVGPDVIKPPNWSPDSCAMNSATMSGSGN
jgi:hypothetical protein